jgi:hypothetical protein
MSSCGADCGITRVREAEREAALAVAERIHPGLVWRESARSTAALVTFDAMSALARHLEELLPMRAIVREAGPAAVDLLAGLHEPCLLEIAEQRRIEPELVFREREVYLRVAFSPWGRFVTILEVDVTARNAGDELEIVEEPLLGVEDPRLRPMVKGLQGALRKARLTLLDMAFLSTPVEGDQKAFVERFAEAPTLWSLLFDPLPAASVRAFIVPNRPSGGCAA